MNCLAFDVGGTTVKYGVIDESYKVLKKLKFIEYPKKGLGELSKIIKKIKSLSGGVLLIDYGYMGALNESTIQIVMKNIFFGTWIIEKTFF